MGRNSECGMVAVMVGWLVLAIIGDLMAQPQPKSGNLERQKVLVWGTHIDGMSGKIFAYRIDNANSLGNTTIEFSVQDKATFDSIVNNARNFSALELILDENNQSIIKDFRVADDDILVWKFAVELEVHPFTGPLGEDEMRAHPVSRVPTLARVRLSPRQDQKPHSRAVRITLLSNPWLSRVGTFAFASYDPNFEAVDLWKIAGKSTMMLTLPQNSEWVNFLVIPHFRQKVLTEAQREWGIMAKWNTSYGLTLFDTRAFVTRKDKSVCKEVALRASCPTKTTISEKDACVQRLTEALHDNDRCQIPGPSEAETCRPDEVKKKILGDRVDDRLKALCVQNAENVCPNLRDLTCEGGLQNTVERIIAR